MIGGDRLASPRDSMRRTGLRAVRRITSAGFTMVELMVALVLGLLLVAVIASIFVGSNRSYKEDNSLSRMQENGRFAMDILATDLGTAGLWGTVTDFSKITVTSAISTPSASSAQCGVTLGPGGPPIVVLKGATNPASTFTCLPTTGNYAPYVPGGGVNPPDVIFVQRVVGNPISSSSVVPGMPYLDITTIISGFGNTGVLDFFQSKPTTTDTYWLYVPRIYYVCNDPITSSLSVPALCRWDLFPNAGVTNPTVIAEGIENLQTDYGADTDQDGAINTFLPQPATAPSASVAMRVDLLVRSRDADPMYVNTKTYDLGPNGALITYPLQSGVPDHYYRQVLTTLLPMRNVIDFALGGA